MCSYLTSRTWISRPTANTFMPLTAKITSRNRCGQARLTHRLGLPSLLSCTPTRCARPAVCAVSGGATASVRSAASPANWAAGSDSGGMAEIFSAYGAILGAGCKGADRRRLLFSGPSPPRRPRGELVAETAPSSDALSRPSRSPQLARDRNRSSRSRAKQRRCHPSTQGRQSASATFAGSSSNREARERARTLLPALLPCVGPGLGVARQIPTRTLRWPDPVFSVVFGAVTRWRSRILLSWTESPGPRAGIRDHGDVQKQAYDLQICRAAYRNRTDDLRITRRVRAIHRCPDGHTCPARAASQSPCVHSGPGPLLANPLAPPIPAAAPTALHPGRAAPGRPLSGPHARRVCGR